MREEMCRGLMRRKRGSEDTGTAGKAGVEGGAASGSQLGHVFCH